MSVILVGASPEKIKNCRPHSHPNWEIVIPLFGHGVVETEKGKRVEFSPGMAYCMPPNLRHSTSSHKGFCDIYIHTDPLLLKSDGITVVRSEGAFVPLGELILSAYLKKDNGWGGIMENTLGLITRLIYDLSLENRQNSLASGVRNYLIENISNHSLNMAAVSGHFGYNPDHIRRVFKEEYGISPMDYLWERRQERAEELLRNMPQYSVEEIGALCGFADRFYFSRFFKKHKGVSPKNFRNG